MPKVNFEDRVVIVTGEVRYGRVDGVKNPGDLMTKGVQRKVLDAHMQALGQEARGGRAATGLKLANAVK